MRDIKFRLWVESENRYYPNFCLRDDGSPFVEGVGGAEMVSWVVCVLEQFTGIHDSLGKEVYEGDIVRFAHSLWEVRWNQAGFWLWRGSPLQGLCDDIGIKVVGNVHESPHLMDDPFENARYGRSTSL